MSAKKNKPPLALDMDFGEALTRFAKTDMKEVSDRIQANKKGKSNKDPKGLE